MSQSSLAMVARCWLLIAPYPCTPLHHHVFLSLLPSMTVNNARAELPSNT